MSMSQASLEWDRLTRIVNEILSGSSMMCDSCRGQIDQCAYGLHCPHCGDVIKIHLTVDDRVEAWQTRGKNVPAVRTFALLIAVFNGIGILAFVLGNGFRIPDVDHALAVGVSIVSFLVSGFVGVRRQVVEQASEARRILILLGIFAVVAAEMFVFAWVSGR